MGDTGLLKEKLEQIGTMPARAPRQGGKKTYDTLPKPTVDDPMLLEVVLKIRNRSVSR